MSIENPTELSIVSIGGVDRSDDVVRVEVWRTLNSVGNWRVALRNIGGAYNNVFDIQDEFYLAVNGLGLVNVLMEGWVDNKGVILQGGNVESTWDEYAIISGVDRAQDLLYLNDFEHTYPDFTQDIDDVLDDVFNVQLAGRVPPLDIIYAGYTGAPLTINGVEFRKGSGFLTTIQEMFNRIDHVFYVDDTGILRCGAPGFPGSATGETIQSIVDDPDNNVFGPVTFIRRDGDKLYNRIEVYSKNPQFDAYTEYTANRWATLGGGWTVFDDTVDHAPIVGNSASVKMTHAPPPALANASITLDFSQMGFDEVDMSQGEIGWWWKYDGGTSATRACCGVALQDNALNQINFYSGPGTPPGGPLLSTVNRTRTIQGEWDWCTAPVGYDIETGAATVPDTWWPYPVGGFNWDRVTDIGFQYQTFGADSPEELGIDGLRLPFAARGFSEDGASQGVYKIRPLIFPATFVRHQIVLEAKSAQLLRHHKESGIDHLKLTVAGNLALKYAGQTVTVQIPQLGLTGDIFYLTEIHHVIEPHVDVSKGYGFDWITEIELAPVSSLIYDLGRFRDGPVFSGAQLGVYGGTGLRMS